MATMNPMQRKSQNSFLLGMLVMLLITGCIIAFLVIQLVKINKENQEEEASKKTVVQLTGAVTSGGSLQEAKTQVVQATSNVVPGDAMSASDITETSVAKIDLQAGTILTKSMIAEEGETSKDVRVQEYNMISLPSQLETGDYVDIRLKTPMGLDFIVVSKKKVTIPEIDGAPSSTTIQMNMTEGEILTLNGAIVDAYIMDAAYLYATVYTDAGNQEAAKITYTPSQDIQSLINGSDIVDTAKKALVARFTEGVRSKIDTEKGSYQEKQLDNVESGIEQQITKSAEERKSYLDALSGN